MDESRFIFRKPNWDEFEKTLLGVNHVCVCDIAIAMKNECSCKKQQLSLLKLELVTFCEILQKKGRNTQCIYYMYLHVVNFPGKLVGKYTIY